MQIQYTAGDGCENTTFVHARKDIFNLHTWGIILLRCTRSFTFPMSTNKSPAPAPTNGTGGYVNPLLDSMFDGDWWINKQSDFSLNAQASVKACQIHYLPANFQESGINTWSLCAKFVNNESAAIIHIRIRNMRFLHETIIKGLPIP